MLAPATAPPCPLSAWSGDPALCSWCDQPIGLRRSRFCSPGCADQYRRNHSWPIARRAAIARDGRCLRCGSSDRLEVNHVEPLWGAGYGPGCHHHLDDLQTLCHDCHLAETVRWRRVRTAFLRDFRLDVATGRRRPRPRWVSPGLRYARRRRWDAA